MKTILVDDELWAMDKFEIEAGAIPDIEIAGKFDRSEEALQFAKENRVDFALLDVEMPGMNGLELSQALKKLYPDMVIIFVSGYDQYVLDALKHGADYYITKPYSSQQVIDILKRARLLSARQEKPVYIRTLNFRVPKSRRFSRCWLIKTAGVSRPRRRWLSYGRARSTRMPI